MTTSTPTPTNNLLQAKLHQAKAQQEQFEQQIHKYHQEALNLLQANTCDTIQALQQELEQFKKSINSVLQHANSDISNAIAGLSTQQLITQLQQEQQALTDTIRTLQQEQALQLAELNQSQQSMIETIKQSKENLQELQEQLSQGFINSMEQTQDRLQVYIKEQTQAQMNFYQSEAKEYSQDLKRMRASSYRATAQPTLEAFKADNLVRLILIIPIIMQMIFFLVILFVMIYLAPKQQQQQQPKMYKPAPLKSYSQFH